MELNCRSGQFAIQHSIAAIIWEEVSYRNQEGIVTYLGLVEQKTGWVLTGRGWLIILVTAALLIVLAITFLYSFLTMNRPVSDGEILIVGGWIPDYLLEQVITEFKTHNYQLLITTGGPLSKGSYLSEYGNYADLTAAILKKMGVNEKVLVSVPTPPVKTDRTYAAALAVNKWLLNNDRSVKSLNIFSVGPHARRSWLLGKLAFGETVEVGVIAVASTEYDPNKWWKSSSGVRTVIGETIAYVYAKFFFYPGE